MSEYKRIVFGAIALCLLSINCFADQIFLKSGDRLTGKIVSQNGESIVLETNFAGVITISKKKIERVSIEKIEADQSVAENKKQESTEIKEVAEIKESAEIKEKEEFKDTEKVAENKTIETGTSENDENLSSVQKIAAANTKAKKRNFAILSGWDGAANLGFSYTSGNARTTTFNSGIRAERSSEKNKWTTYFNALWNRNRTNGINLTTSNAVWGGVRYDRNITKKLFAFVSYDFERDRPQLLNFRSVVGAGLGYHIIKNDRTELDAFSGIAWNRTWFIGENKSQAEFLVGNTLKHKLNERVKIQQGFTFYPSLTDGGAYRFIFDSTLSADVTSRIGWFVTVGDRFNSSPQFGAQKNDFLFTTGLKWSFGKK